MVLIKTEVIEKCFGCAKIKTDQTCEVYGYPEAKWSAGKCPMASHIERKSSAEEKALDPIKASKRKMKGEK